MARLSGPEAVERLERRGGQVLVFRMQYGLIAEYSCVGREDGFAVIESVEHSGTPDRSDPPRPVRKGRVILRSDADRSGLASDMERVLDASNATLNPGVEHDFRLRHRDTLDTDGGYAQVGCFLAFFSVVVGTIAGLILTWIAIGSIEAGATVYSMIAGFVFGFFVLDPVTKLAVNVRFIRDRITNMAYAWTAIVPAVVTAVAMPILTSLLD